MLAGLQIHCCILQDNQRQLAGLRVDKSNISETVGAQAVHIRELTEEIASVTSARDHLRTKMEQKGKDLSKAKSGSGLWRPGACLPAYASMPYCCLMSKIAALGWLPHGVVLLSLRHTTCACQLTPSCWSGTRFCCKHVTLNAQGP